MGRPLAALRGPDSAGARHELHSADDDGAGGGGGGGGAGCMAGIKRLGLGTKAALLSPAPRRGVAGQRENHGDRRGGLAARTAQGSGGGRGGYI